MAKEPGTYGFKENVNTPYTGSSPKAPKSPTGDTRAFRQGAEQQEGFQRGVRRIGRHVGRLGSKRKIKAQIAGYYRRGNLETPIYWTLAIILDVITISAALIFGGIGAALTLLILVILAFILVPPLRYMMYFFGLTGIILIALKIIATLFLPLIAYVPVLTLIMLFKAGSSSARSPAIGAGGGAGYGAGGGYAGGPSNNKSIDYYAQGRAKGLGEQAARQGTYGGLLRFRTFFRVMKPIFIILIIGVIGLLVYMNQTGQDISEFFGLQATATLQEYGILGIAKEYIYNKPAAFFQKQVYGIGDFSAPESEATHIIQGVTLSAISTGSGPIRENIAFYFNTIADINALDEQVIVAFSCGIRDPKTNEEIKGNIEFTNTRSEDGSDYLTVLKGKHRSVTVTCLTPKIDLPEELNFKPYLAYINWEYFDFTTKTIMKIFILDSQTKQTTEQPLGPYVNEVDKEGYAKPLCVQNCGLADLAQDVGSSMPLTEGGNYPLDLQLLNIDKTFRGGKVTSIKRVAFTFEPQGKAQVIPERCADFGQDLTFDAGDASFAYVNDLVKKDELNTLRLKCYITIPTATQNIETVNIIGTATYDYGSAKTKVITILSEDFEGLNT